MPSFVCKCGQKCEIPQSALGKKVQCPKCKTVVFVKAPEQAAPVQPATIQPVPAPLQSQAPLGQDPLGNPLAGMPGTYPQTSAQPNPHSNVPQAYGSNSRGAVAARRRKSKQLLLILGISVGAVVLVGGLGLVAVLSGGGANEVADAEVSSPNSVAPTRKAAVGELIPASEAKAIAERVVALCEEGGRRSELYAIFDFQELTIRGLDGLNMSPTDRKGFLAGLQTGGAQEKQIGSLEQLAQGGSCGVLRVREIEGEMRALCRFFTADTGGVYVDLVFYRAADGKIRVADFATIPYGLLYSQEIRNVAFAVVQAKRGALTKLVVGKSPLEKHVDEFVEFAGAVASNPQRAIQIFDSLPKEVQDLEFVLLQAVVASSQLADATNLRLLERYDAMYPGTTAAMINKINYHFIKEEYGKCIDVFRQLDRMVGGDAATNYEVALMYFSMGDIGKAKEEHVTAIRRDPEFAESYLELISLHMAAGEFVETNKYIESLRQNCPDWEIDLTSFDNYQAFRNSSQFTE